MNATFIDHTRLESVYPHSSRRSHFLANKGGFSYGKERYKSVVASRISGAF